MTVLLPRSIDTTFTVPFSGVSDGQITFASPSAGHDPSGMYSSSTSIVARTTGTYVIHAHFRKDTSVNDASTTLNIRVNGVAVYSASFATLKGSACQSAYYRGNLNAGDSVDLTGRYDNASIVETFFSMSKETL